MKLLTLVRAGFLTAASDFAFATVLTIFFFNGTSMRLWQGVASVPLGREALEGGAWTMGLGLALHLWVAVWWSGVFLARGMDPRPVGTPPDGNHGRDERTLSRGRMVWEEGARPSSRPS